MKTKETVVKILVALKKAFILSFLMLAISSVSSFVWAETEADSSESSDFSYRINYGLQSNLADKSEKLFIHSIGYSMGYSAFSQFSLGANLNVNYRSINTEVIKDNGRVFEFSDVSLFLTSNKISLSQFFNQKSYFQYAVSNKFPLSQQSRHEGFRSIPSVSGDLVFKKYFYSISGSWSSSYVLNSYKTSVKGGLPNLESSHSLQFKISAKYKAFSASYSYYGGVRTTTDHSHSGFSGNKVSMNSYYKNILASLSFSNISRIDDQYIDAWFSDPYRRVVQFNIGVVF